MRETFRCEYIDEGGCSEGVLHLYLRDSTVAVHVCPNHFDEFGI